MDDLGYKPVFDTSAEWANKSTDFDKAVRNFRNHPEFFHFIIANQESIYPDIPSLQMARAINGKVFEALMRKGPSKIGGGPDHLDAVESKHILMLTYLITKIGTDWGNVLEFGGGYANWFRLIQGIVNYTDWTIIDLPHISKLQAWVIRELEIQKNVGLLHADEVESYQLRPTIVIGTHSLSEFSLKDFGNYFNTIKEAEYLFYVSHNNSPSPILLYNKLNLISTRFKLVDQLLYESNNCTMYLFRSIAS